MDVLILLTLSCDFMPMEEIILSEEDKVKLLEALFPFLSAALVAALATTFIKVFYDGRYIE